MTTPRIPGCRTSPSGDGPSGQCWILQRPRCQLPRKLVGGAECVLSVLTTNPAPSVRTRAHNTPYPNTQLTTTKKRQPTRMKTSDPDTKRPTQIPRPEQVKLRDYIGKYVVSDAEEVIWIGWTESMRWRQGVEILLLCWRWRNRRSACCRNTSIAARQ